jgi:phosphate transport system substrate-binding protein
MIPFILGGTMKRGLSGALMAALVLAGCGGESAGNGRSPAEMAAGTGGAGQVTLTGAGATFPYPLYAKWFAQYDREHPVRVNYQSIGSGGGIRQLTAGTVDFGASDAPMNAEELEKAPGTLHLPTVIGAIAVTYNLPELKEPLKLDGATLADIFLGRITRWNDAKLQALNPGVTLPARDILAVERSDGSGTTYVFTEYLSAVSPAWKEKVGAGKSVRWPVGLAAKGNEGVAGQVKQTEGAIGYVEQVYAAQNGLSSAALRNASGHFVAPTLEATTAAAAGIAEKLTPDTDFRISIVNAAGAEAYPISSWTYLLVPQQIESCSKAGALVGLIDWALTSGSGTARELGYAPLPDAARERVLEKAHSVTCGADHRLAVEGAPK